MQIIKGVDKKYRKFIAGQNCAKCDVFLTNHIAPAHQRILGGGGMALKPHDKDILPLCTIPGIDCHGKEHNGAVTFWEQGTKAKTKIYVQGLCDGYIKSYTEEMK